jgi:DNA-binding response OmpR family regulator
MHCACKVLIVEGNRDDAALIRGAFEKNNTTVNDVSDGGLCIRLLWDRQTVFPNLILLDTATPGWLELLTELKNVPTLRSIPVIVLSDCEQSIAIAHELLANCCVPKPSDRDELAATIKAIQSFWVLQTQLPVKRAEDPFEHRLASVGEGAALRIP